MSIRKPSGARYWTEFKRWCQVRGLKALPAHPWTIAVYLRWVDRRKDIVAVREALAAISREHLLKTARVPERHPTVQQTLAALELRAETKDRHSDLFDEKDMLDTAPTFEVPVEEPATPGKISLSAEPKLVRRRPRKATK